LQNNRVTIPQLTLENKGTATLSGDITLAGFLPDEVGAKLRLDNFKAIDKLGSEALVSGAVNLSGRWPRPGRPGQPAHSPGHLPPQFSQSGHHRHQQRYCSGEKGGKAGPRETQSRPTAVNPGVRGLEKPYG
jgi:hypothetical protein